MPIYEYVCVDCGHEFEELRPSGEERDRVRCASCQGTSVNRKLSVFAARMGSPSPATPNVPGGCGRCGDPNGPCAF